WCGGQAVESRRSRRGVSSVEVRMGANASNGGKRRQRRAPDLEGGGLLSIETAARRLGVAAVTLRNWIRGGRLPYVRLGRRTLIRAGPLVDFIRGPEGT